MVKQEMASLQGGAIIPELCVYVTLRYLAGGLYTDIFYLISISQALFYRLLWKTINAITTVLNYGFLGCIPRKGN